MRGGREDRGAIFRGALQACHKGNRLIERIISRVYAATTLRIIEIRLKINELDREANPATISRDCDLEKLSEKNRFVDAAPFRFFFQMR